MIAIDTNVLINSSKYQLQHEDIFILALERFKTSNAGFSDSLIATESQQKGCKLWTFDRKFSHQKTFSAYFDDK